MIARSGDSGDIRVQVTCFEIQLLRHGLARVPLQKVMTLKYHGYGHSRYTAASYGPRSSNLIAPGHVNPLHGRRLPPHQPGSVCCSGDNVSVLLHVPGPNTSWNLVRCHRSTWQSRSATSRGIPRRSSSTLGLHGQNVVVQILPLSHSIGRRERYTLLMGSPRRSVDRARRQSVRYYGSCSCQSSASCLRLDMPR